MSIIKSALYVRSEEFRANAAAMRTLVDDLRDKVAQVARGGSEEARARHLARGKLLARDRVNALLDPGTPFLELSQLAAFGIYGGDVPAAGVVAGIGRVSGQECVIVANDATVKGGTTTRSRSRSICALKKSPRPTVCPASISSTQGGRSCLFRTRSFPTATISAASSSTKPTCRRKASRRSRSSWARAQPAEPTCRPCRTRPSSSKTRARFFWAARRS